MLQSIYLSFRPRVETRGLWLHLRIPRLLQNSFEVLPEVLTRQSSIQGCISISVIWICNLFACIVISDGALLQNLLFLYLTGRILQSLDFWLWHGQVAWHERWILGYIWEGPLVALFWEILLSGPQGCARIRHFDSWRTEVRVPTIALQNSL